MLREITPAIVVMFKVARSAFPEDPIYQFANVLRDQLALRRKAEFEANHHSSRFHACISCSDDQIDIRHYWRDSDWQLQAENELTGAVDDRRKKIG